MRRLIFAALVLAAAAPAGVPAAVGAQPVPARDLLDFPIGTVAEAPALASTVGDGLWNPATVLLANGQRAHVALAALATSAQQGVSAQTLAAAVHLPQDLTVGLGVVRAGVRDLQRTLTDPQTVGDIPYGTTVGSLTVARRLSWATGGIAVRYRTGELDGVTRGVLGLDAGAVTRAPTWRDLRVGMASYLWRPAVTSDDRPAITAATDARLAGTSEVRELRAGASLVATRAFGTDSYVHLAGRSGRFAMRGGVVRTRAFGLTSWSTRLGVGLHYARYVVAFSREEGQSGLSPSYQFTLSSSYQ